MSSIHLTREQQDIIDAGVLITLCRHAHSSNLQLRLNSLWALKHLVHAANNQLKMNCVRELGVGWLKQIICNEADDTQNNTGPSISMGSSNAAGEQVDLLNAVDTNGPHSSINEPADEEDEVSMVDSVGNLNRSGTAESHEASARRTALAQEEEADRIARSRRDDVLVQEQGLDLIRNLLGGTGNAEMIDFVFQEFGREALFSIFANLLRTRTGNTSAGPAATPPSSPISSSASPAPPSVPPHPEIVLAVVFILVHLATGYPQHKHTLLQQTELMRLFVPLAAHPSASVRMAYAWFVINLTWVEDSGDKMGARGRALELRHLGLDDRLEGLQRDSDLDVRERAKQAAAALADLLKGGA